MVERPPFDWRDLAALAAIASPFALGWALVSPWQNVPVIDDWVYAWSVEHFLKTGRLEVADISAVYPVAQLAWGAVFARVFGFSFGALRLSTIPIAIAGCWGVYLMLKEVGISRAASLITALTVAWHPVYFALSFSFMTDVPFVALTSVALYFYISALRRNRFAWLWWGAFFSVLAFLVRPIAVLLPCAALTVLATRGVQRIDPPAASAGRMLAPVAVAGLMMGALWVLLPKLFGPLSGANLRFEGLRYWFLVTAREYATWNINLFHIAPFPFAPLFLAALVTRKSLIRVAGVSAVLLLGLAVTLHSIPTPLPDWQTWSLQDIGARAMIAGTGEPSGWSTHVLPIVTATGLIVAAALLVAIAVAIRRAHEGWILLVFGALYFVALNILWFYNDRYYLVFVPTFAYVAARSLPSSRAALSVAAVLLVLWAVVSITGVRDMLATNAACSRLAARLEARGVAPAEVDAGYALNGWRLYVHPENLPPGADRRYEVPYVNSDRETEYRISSGPLPGYDVVEEEKLPAAMWQVTDRLYVLRRRNR